MTKTFPITIRLISQVEYGEEITQEDWEQLETDLHNNRFITIGNSVVPSDRVEIIYQG